MQKKRTDPGDLRPGSMVDDIKRMSFALQAARNRGNVKSVRDLSKGLDRLKREFRDEMVGRMIVINRMEGEPQYGGKIGVVQSVDDCLRLHGTWGGLAVDPALDEFMIAKEVKVEPHLLGKEIAPGVCEITDDQARALFDSEAGPTQRYEPWGRFVCRSESPIFGRLVDGWDAIDNSTYDAWTEWFRTKEQAVAWLLGLGDPEEYREHCYAFDASGEFLSASGGPHRKEEVRRAAELLKKGARP